MPSSLRIKAVLVAAILAPLACMALSLYIGRYPVPIDQVGAILLGRLVHPLQSSAGDIPYTVIMDIRLPRALVGALVGGALAVSGTAFQGLFKNPLVSSGILGVSSGAGFGAALSILLFQTVSAAYPMALCFGILAVFMSYAIGRIYQRTPAIMLVLGGVIVSSVFSALVSLVKYVADPYEQLPAIVFWLMGSLAGARMENVALAAPPILLGAAGLWCLRFRINVLSMGDKEARTLAGRMGLTRTLVIVCATLATAGAVSVSGVIGWIGLIIPHIGRMLVGNDNRILIPVSFSLGACFLILIDIACRGLTGSEIPVGILTALCGAPFFVYLLKKTRGRGW
jgi:iron complex transport system permease protein